MQSRSYLLLLNALTGVRSAAPRTRVAAVVAIRQPRSISKPVRTRWYVYPLLAEALNALAP